ncbi:MAG: GGDEF domain-containing phosphodiesterase, partial [Pseudoxanthomonas sp.]
MLNRELLFDTIERLASPRTGTGALLMVRMRNLHDYEAMFGYEAGDALVQAFEARLQACLRSADVAVRIGECDFAVMLPGLADRNHVSLAAAKVSRTFREPLQVRNRPAWTNVAVGACAVADAENPSALCRQADLACTQAWSQGERHFLHAGLAATPVGYEDLQEAIAGNQMQLFLQPIFSLQGGELKSFESLSRWVHPLHGPIRPAVFVPMAEQGGLIHELTRWNLNSTFRHCAPCIARHPGLKCAVNISPLALTAPGFVEQMASAFRLWNIAPTSVVLEVTETAFVDNQEQLVTALSALHAVGVGISIDDFGTGYSSLSYIRRFPVDELKIDMSFVHDLADSARAARLVSWMIEMAHGMGAIAVAEGLEGAETWARLRDMGCDHGQ